MKKSQADKLLNKIENDYNKIAVKFSNSRRNITKDLIGLGQYSKEGDNVLDLGCGDGRFFKVLKDKHIKYTGADISQEMLAIAKKQHPDLKFDKIDSIKLPYPDQTFDVVYALSVFHHLPGFRGRAKFLNEIKRVLKIGGKVVLTVWNIKKAKGGRYLILQYGLLSLVKDYDWGDVFYPFSVPEERFTIKRYIHSFSQKELVNYFKILDFKILNSKVIPRGNKFKNENFLIVAEK